MFQEGLSSAIKTWKERLAFLEEKLASVSSANEEFSIRKEIEKCHSEINRLNNESAKLRKNENKNNNEQELHEALELFDQLQPRDQTERLMLLLNMPTDHRPSSRDTLAQKKDAILNY